MINTILQGDCLEVMRGLPDGSVQMICTSPPYYGLRDYGVAGQIGLEQTPAAYIAKLVAVLHEARRLLRDDGVLWLNIGDSYAGGSRGRDDSGENGKFAGPRIERKDNAIPGGFKPKDLMMIPARVAIALQEDGWYLRSDIIWHKPTAMPESVTDRPTNAHEHIFLLAKNERYYYDADAIREPGQEWKGQAGTFARSSGKATLLQVPGQDHASHRERDDRVPTGRNKRNVWTVASSPYSGAHFAVFPSKLIEPCILAGSRPGDVVLDPFMGAGTTALVALQHGRQFLGCELNQDYIDLAYRRIETVQPHLWTEAAS